MQQNFPITSIKKDYRRVCTLTQASIQAAESLAIFLGIFIRGADCPIRLKNIKLKNANINFIIATKLFFQFILIQMDNLS